MPDILDEFQTYGIDPLNPQVDSGQSSSGGPAQPIQPNAWLKILQRMRQQPSGQQQGMGQRGWNPVQTYSSLGNMAGQAAAQLFGLADGGFVHGPTRAMIGEAGPEELIHGDGSRELIAGPQLRTLGTNGNDAVVPLTPGPHRPNEAMRSILKRLHIKRFGDGGFVDDEDPYAMPYGPGPDFGEPPPMLNSPESAMIPDWVGSAADSGMSPGIAPPTREQIIRDKIAALKTPVPSKPSILQRLGAGALGAAAGYVNASGKRMQPIDASGGQQAILHPGFGQQVAEFQGQQADLQRQLEAEKATQANAYQQAQMAHLGAQTDLTKAQTSQFGYDKLMGALEKNAVIEDQEAPRLTSPEADQAEQARHAGSHMQVGGKRVYFPTQAEQEESKRRGQKANYEEIPAVVAAELGLTKGMRVPPDVAQRYYATYAKSQETKNPTNVTLAVAAAKGDPTAKAALELLKPPPDPMVGANRALTNAVLQDKVNSAGQARADKSYQFNVGQLNNIGKPISDATMRMGRLQDTINQMTPQADALIAPELLTVMAGGQGSGLRMNEAEISRVIGGRSNLESLRAALNKWQLDPTKALSVTPSQRKQMRDLVREVGNKLAAKQTLLDEASNALVGTDDPTEHRKVVVGLKKALTAIDQGSAQTAVAKTATTEQVQAYANAHKMTYDQAKKQAQSEGFDVSKAK